MSDQPPAKEDAVPAESTQTTETTGSTDREVVVPADAIEDFGNLELHETGYNQYNVLHLRGEYDVSAHHVDLNDWTCQPRDPKHNTCNAETCKHLAYAAYHAPKRRTVEDEAVRGLSMYVRDVRKAADRIERLASGVNADQVASTTEAQQQAESGGSSPEPDDPLGLVQAWLDENVAASTVPDLEVTDHDDKMGVAIDPNNQNMSDGQYKGFKAAIGELDGVNWHIGFGDDPCDTCGEQDGEFYVFIPYDVEEVYGNG